MAIIKERITTYITKTIEMSEITTLFDIISRQKGYWNTILFTIHFKATFAIRQLLRPKPYQHVIYTTFYWLCSDNQTINARKRRNKFHKHILYQSKANNVWNSCFDDSNLLYQIISYFVQNQNPIKAPANWYKNDDIL